MMMGIMMVTALMKLIVDMMSQPSRAVVWYCKLNKIPHEAQLVRLTKGEHLTVLKDIVPVRVVPTMIEDDGFAMWESHAIMRYLAATRPVDTKWFPTEPRARAKVDMILDWHHGNLRRGAAGYTWGTVLGPSVGMKISPEVVTECKGTLHKSLKLLDGLLGKTQYLAGADATIADLSAYCEIEQLRFTDYTLDAYPALVAWQGRMKAIPYRDEVHAGLEKVLGLLKTQKAAAAPQSKL